MKKIITLCLFAFLGTTTVNAQNFTTGPQVGNTGNYFYGITTKDVNGDGYEDIFSEDGSFNLRVVLSNGSGGFNSPVTIGSGYQNYDLGDLDNDGDIDMVAASTTAFYIYKNNGSGSFTLQSSTPTSISFSNASPVTYAPDIVIFDANGDGKKDVLLMPYLNSTNGSFSLCTKHFLFLNTTSGSSVSFSQSAIITTNSFSTHGMAADVDNDGDQDLVLDGSYSWGTEVYKNDGSGNFSYSNAPGGYSGGQFMYDWNNDGFLDIITIDYYNNYGLRWKQNDGQGNFAAGVGLLGVTGNCFFADMNGDGLVDAVNGTNDGNLNIYTNTGCGFSSTPTISFPLSSPSGVAKIDANNDGKPDVFVTPSGIGTIMLNNIATATAPVLSTITSVTDAARCGNGNVTLNAVASNSGSIKWWNAASGGSQVTTGGSYAAAVSSSSSVQNYYVDATLNGCTSSRVKVSATYKGAATSSTMNTTILVTQLPYSWNGNKTAAGTYTFTTTNSKGCDSVATLNLTTLNSLPPITGASSVCVGSNITLINSFTGGVWSHRGIVDISQSGVVTGKSGGTTTISYKVGNYVTTKVVTVNALPATPSIGYKAPFSNPQRGAPYQGFCVGKVFGVLGTPTGGVWSTTGCITATTGGVATINTTGAGSLTYRYTNANGCVNSRTMTGAGYTCAARGTTLINNEKQETRNEFSMYPNPAKSYVNLQVETLVGQGQIIVTDLYGKTVKIQPLSMGNNTVDIANLSKGFYLISTITSEGKTTKKLVISN